jgi:hypothetical protein
MRTLDGLRSYLFPRPLARKPNNQFIMEDPKILCLTFFVCMVVTEGRSHHQFRGFSIKIGYYTCHCIGQSLYCCIDAISRKLIDALQQRPIPDSCRQSCRTCLSLDITKNLFSFRSLAYQSQENDLPISVLLRCRI